MDLWLMTSLAVMLCVLGWSIAGLKLRYELPGRVLFGAILPPIVIVTLFVLFDFSFVNGRELEGEDLGMRYAFGGLAWVFGSIQLMIPTVIITLILEYLFTKRVE